MAEQGSRQSVPPDRRERVEATDIYVLYREAGMARYPFLAAWVVRHRLSAGFRAAHATRFRRVVVIGSPDGLDLAGSRVVYVRAEEAERRMAVDPSPAALFAEGS